LFTIFFFYNAGVDFRAVSKVTIAADFLGEREFSARRVLPIVSAGQPSIAVVSGSFDTGSAALGVKINPIGNLLISGNVLARLDHNGLRYRDVPLVGLSYTF
jgi:hypothetical protein